MNNSQVTILFQSLISNLYRMESDLESNQPVKAYQAQQRALEVAVKLRDEFVKP